MDAKALNEDLENLRFTPSLATSETRKGDWKTKGPLIRRQSKIIKGDSLGRKRSLREKRDK